MARYSSSVLQWGRGLPPGCDCWHPWGDAGGVLSMEPEIPPRLKPQGFTMGAAGSRSLQWGRGYSPDVTSPSRSARRSWATFNGTRDYSPIETACLKAPRTMHCTFNGAKDYPPVEMGKAYADKLPYASLQWSQGLLPGSNPHPHRRGFCAPASFNGAGDYSPDVTATPF